MNVVLYLRIVEICIFLPVVICEFIYEYNMILIKKF